MYPWTEKYLPKKIFDVQGHDGTIEKLKSYVVNFKKGAVLAYGPTGCGKTSSIYAIANDLNYEILEVNASDLRNKDKMLSVVGGSAGQMSLFSRGKVILVDEIDALSGMKDRGCLQALVKIISTSSWPIILIADDPWDSKLKDIRKKCTLIEFGTLSYLSVSTVLKNICVSENIEFDEDILNSLARKCAGDVRASINDLQVLSAIGNKLDSYEGIVDDRYQTENIFNALKLVFKSKTPENVIHAFDNVDMDQREVRMWIDENLPLEYNGQDLINAYDSLSRADVFYGRIMRWQYWRYLVYIYNFMTVGVALAKEERNKKFVNYKRSGRILKLWQAKMKYGKRNAIAEKLAEHTHTSRKRALKDTLPFIKKVFENGKGNAIAEELRLNPEEIAYLSSN
jgi:replication factor C large subunit